MFNASPDICAQIASFSVLSPSNETIRGSAIDAIILTDGEMDHIVGLLSLREQSDFQLVCTKSVRRLLTNDFPILMALENYCTIRYSIFPFQIGTLIVSAFNISKKNPRYAKSQLSEDSVIGVKVTSTKTNKILVYLPSLTNITDEVKYFVEGCNCLLIDGTFWSNDEMVSLGITKRNARDMGHVPINGKDGSLTWLCGLDIPHKIYTHINNTNPILLETSKERKIIDENKIKVSYDGMDILI